VLHHCLNNPLVFAIIAMEECNDKLKK